MNLVALWQQGDAVSRGVIVVLLCMSVLTWVVIVYKGWLVARARRSVPRSIAAYWQAADATAAWQGVRAHDPLRLVLPLLDGVQGPDVAAQATLEATGSRAARLTRRLREALGSASRQLQWGQIVLATIGSTAPFVGLLGTVWGINHALTGLAGAGALSIDKVAGPVGESLIMTAFGLLVAIPSVMAYNVFGRLIAGVVEQLDGLAHDLLALYGEAA